MKNRIAILFVLLLFGSAFADTGSVYPLVQDAGTSTATNAVSSFIMFSDGIIALPSALVAASIETGGPSISYVYFDGRLIEKDDYVRANATITSKITDTVGLDLNLCSVEVDGVGIGFQSSSGGTTFTNDILTLQKTYADGTHTLKINAYSLVGNYTSYGPKSFKVQGGDLKVSGAVLCYKNPFNPGIGESTSITYMLNNNADVVIYIYNMIGQLIKKINCPSGTAGGSAGYNQVPWDGYSDFKEIVGNDVYFIKVVSGGSVMGKCKIAVLK